MDKLFIALGILHLIAFLVGLFWMAIGIRENMCDDCPNKHKCRKLMEENQDYVPPCCRININKPFNPFDSCL